MVAMRVRAAENNTTVLTPDVIVSTSSHATTGLPHETTLSKGLVEGGGPSTQDYTGSDGKKKEEDLHRRNFCKALSIFLNVKVAIDSFRPIFIVEPVGVHDDISFSVIFTHTHIIDGEFAG